MEAAKIPADVTISLPDSVRRRLRPGDEVRLALTVDESGNVSAECVGVVRARKRRGPSLREMIERVQTNPAPRT